MHEEADRFILTSIWYQWGATALHRAAKYGRTEVAILLINRGAYVNLTDKVSDMIWKIVIIDCESACFIATMICDGSVMVMSTCQRQQSTMIDTNVIILFNNSLQLHISDMFCTYLGVWDEMRWDEISSSDNVIHIISGWTYSTS